MTLCEVPDGPNTYRPDRPLFSNVTSCLSLARPTVYQSTSLVDKLIRSHFLWDCTLAFDSRTRVMSFARITMERTANCCDLDRRPARPE
jgi:hypothetical protein